MVALDVVGADEHAGHQRVVGDMAVALVEGGKRLLNLLRASDRLDDPLDEAAEVILDLVGLPPLGRAAEGVADGSPRQTGDGPVCQRVFAHIVSSLRNRGFWGSSAGRSRTGRPTSLLPTVR